MGGEEKNQDRLYWNERLGIGAVCDGLSESLYSGAEEKDLVRAVVRGDRDALDRFHSLYSHPIYRFVFYRLGGATADVEEVVQDTFLAALEGVHRFIRGG